MPPKTQTKSTDAPTTTATTETPLAPNIGALLAKASAMVKQANTLRERLEKETDKYTENDSPYHEIARQLCDSLTEIENDIMAPPQGFGEVAKGVCLLVAAVSGICEIIRAREVGVFFEDYMRAGYIRQLTDVSTHIDSAIKGLRQPLIRRIHFWPQELEKYFQSLHESKTNPSYLSQEKTQAAPVTAVRRKQDTTPQSDAEREAEMTQRLLGVCYQGDVTQTREAVRIALGKTQWTKTNDKLREIDRVLPYRLDVTGVQIAAALEPPVSRQNVCATKFWTGDFTVRQNREKQEKRSVR